MSAEIGTTLLHYRLVEKIGEGGMGVVWRARDLKLDRDIAIKFLPNEFAGDPVRRARFEREAKAVAAIRHPNIVVIHSVEEAEGTCFFTMEMVEGEPLTRRILPGGLAVDDFLDLAIPVTEAIAAAHERGIIHRDLKPGNIMVDRGGAVKILDFGLARFLERPVSTADRADTTTATIADGILAGTARYMAPEQLRGEPLDHRADLFSLGMILFELATGEPPFSGDTSAEAIASILKDEPRSATDFNPRLPRRLDEILNHCLEKEARLRMPSAVELRQDLEPLRREGGAEQVEAGRSIAVLPFLDLSPEKDQAYFCEGMAEEIISALTQVRSVRVASRSSSFQFKDGGVDSREVGRRLRVGALLEGSVRKSGNRLRITAQLVDTGGGFHLWSERFDREMKDIFEIQEEIASNIVRALRLTLSPQERGALRRAPTRHVQAYDYYLRGRKFYYQYGKRDIEFALQLFSRAIELDHEYALAHAGVADCWAYLYLYSERENSLRDQAEAASRRALELEPGSGQARASRAVALSLAGRREEAQPLFESAIRLDPNLWEAFYFYARDCFARGDLEKAAGLYEGASRARPDDYQTPLLVAQIYDDLGRAEDGRASRLRGVALAEDRLELNPDDARATYMAANGLVALGEIERGLKLAQRAREMAPEEPMLLYNLGCIYALAGEKEEALDCLERSVRHGLTQKGWFEQDSNLDGLRDHPRFAGLLALLP